MNASIFICQSIGLFINQDKESITRFFGLRSLVKRLSVCLFGCCLPT